MSTLHLRRRKATFCCCLTIYSQSRRPEIDDIGNLILIPEVTNNQWCHQFYDISPIAVPPSCNTYEDTTRQKKEMAMQSKTQRIGLTIFYYTIVHSLSHINDWWEYGESRAT